MIFGRSWGSALVLAYSETHPEHVSGMVIRGVFTGTAAELEHIYGNNGARRYSRSASQVPVSPVQDSTWPLIDCPSADTVPVQVSW